MYKRILRYIAFLCVLLLITSIGGVFAAWNYTTTPAPAQKSLYLSLEDFDFSIEMPSDEVSFVQRLSDILNNEYTTDNITNSLDYLINDTIQVYWEPGADPYVGSMDANFKPQIDALFGDILSTTNVSFILKNEDLTWDGISEIAMYSTSDPLDCVKEFVG